MKLTKLLASIFLLTGGAIAPAVTISDFGFDTMGAQPRFTRPMLLLVAEFAPTEARTVGGVMFIARPRNTLARTDAQYSRFMFSLTPDPSLFSGRGVNPYFYEMSSRLFLWSNAGTLPKRNFSLAETKQMEESSNTYTVDGNPVTIRGIESTAGCSYIVSKFLASNPGFSVASFDTNGDNVITHDELSVVIVCNSGVPSDVNGERVGANRGLFVPNIPNPANPSTPVTLSGRVAWLDHRASISTWTHEISHTFGTEDIYIGNQIGQNRANTYAGSSTLMGGTLFGGNDDSQAFHLDPWHKMKLGWLQPRLVPMSAGGGFILRCAQSPGNEGPILIYDDSKPANEVPREFFMVEYRAQAPQVGPGYDASVAATGVLIWHVGTDANGKLYRLPDPTNPPDPADINGPRTCIVEGRDANNTAFLRGGDVTNPASQVWVPSLYSLIPQLRRFDGSLTPVTLRATAMPDGNSIFLTVSNPRESWAHFRPLAPGAPEDGSFSNPWNTFTEGHGTAGWGGSLKIKPSVTNETGTFKRALTITAVGGPVTIGRQ